MSEPIEQASQTSEDDRSRRFSDLRPTGILWALNRYVFHPRGMALALHFENKDGSGEPTGWSVDVAPTGEAYYFPSSMDDEGFRMFEAFIAGAREEIEVVGVVPPSAVILIRGGKNEREDNEAELMLAEATGATVLHLDDDQEIFGLDEAAMLEAGWQRADLDAEGPMPGPEPEGDDDDDETEPASDGR